MKTYEVEVHVQPEDDPESEAQVLKMSVDVTDEELETIDGGRGLEGDALENVVHRTIEDQARALVELDEGEIIRSLYVRESQEDS